MAWRARQLTVIVACVAVATALGWRAYCRALPYSPPLLSGPVTAVGEKPVQAFVVGGEALVHAGPDTQVRHRAGGPGAVAVGQTVSVWGVPYPPVHPPQYHATLVVIEP